MPCAPWMQCWKNHGVFSAAKLKNIKPNHKRTCKAANSTCDSSALSHPWLLGGFCHNGMVPQQTEEFYSWLFAFPQYCMTGVRAGLNFRQHWGGHRNNKQWKQRFNNFGQWNGSHFVIGETEARRSSSVPPANGSAQSRITPILHQRLSWEDEGLSCNQHLISQHISRPSAPNSRPGHCLTTEK